MSPISPSINPHFAPAAPATPNKNRTLTRAVTFDGNLPTQSRGVHQNGAQSQFAQSLDVDVERRRHRSLKKKRQLLRLSSSSFVPLPLDVDDFTTSRRSLVRRQRSRHSEFIQSIASSTASGTGTPLPEAIPELPELPPPDVAEELNNPNVDGGWAWAVMVASFVLIFIVDGIAFSFGVFLDVLIKEFGQDKSTTSLVGSVLSGLYLGAGRSKIHIGRGWGMLCRRGTSRHNIPLSRPNNTIKKKKHQS